MNNKELIKKQYLKSIKWAKKHQMGGIIPQQGNPYMNQGIYTLLMTHGMMPQMQHYSSMPSMYPQQGLITNTLPNVVLSTLPNALDLYKQSLTLADEALKAYNDKEESKKEAAKAKIEARNKKAANLGSNIGKMVGKIGASALNSAVSNRAGSDSLDIPEETKSLIDESILNTTQLNLLGAADFNKQFMLDVQNDFAAFRLPPIKAEKGKSLLKVK